MTAQTKAANKLKFEAGDVPTAADFADLIDSYADVSHTQAASTISDSTPAGRAMLTAANAAAQRTLLNVADGANAYAHPNHTGDVTSVADGATTIAASAVTNAKMANMASGTVKARLSAGAGAPEDVAMPARILGSINPLRHSGEVAVGAVSGAQRVTNGTLLQSAFNVAFAQRKYLEVDPVRIEYDCQTTDDGVNCGLYHEGQNGGIICASMETKFIQYAVNHPALTIGNVGPANSGDETYWGTYRNIHCGYGVSQAGQTGAAGLLLGNHFMSTFEDVQVSRWISGGDFPPYVGIRVSPTNGKCFFFNVEMAGKTNVNAATQSLLEFRPNTTGNTWHDVYLGGGGVGNRFTLAGPAIATPGRTNLMFGKVHQLNIEWCSATQLVANTCRGFLVGGFHIEGVALTGFGPSIIGNDSGYMHIEKLDILNPWIASPGASGTASIVSNYGSGGVHIESLAMQADGGTEQIVERPIEVMSDNTGAIWRNFSGKVGRMDFNGSGITGAVTLDPHTPGAAITANGGISGHNGYQYHTALSETVNANIRLSNANLTVYGRHYRARVEAAATLTANRDLTLSDRMSASGAGSASVRRPGDIVRVVRSGAGAFDLLVKNQSGTTLHTFVGAGSANTERSFEWSGTAWSAL